MKRNIATLARTTFLITAFLMFTSCRHSVHFGDGVKGSGNLIEQTRTINGNFEFIEASTGVEVLLEQSDTSSVTVNADDNLQQFIITNVENGVLYISSTNSYESDNNVVVMVKMPVVSGITTNSSSTLKSLNNLITENIAVKSSSGSEIALDVEADYISVESSSGSSAHISGKALKLETSSSSGSVIDTGTLMANDIFSQATSGSSTTVNPILTLDGKASSGASIMYMNVPKSLTKEESSSGSVSKR